MKLRSIIAVAAVASFATAAFAEQADIKVPTMVCKSCCKNIVSAIKGVEGVSAVKPDMDNKVMKVTYNSKENLIAKIEKAVSKAGYQANDVKADPKAFAALDDCCKAK